MAEEEAGSREVKRAFEEVTTRNVKAAIVYSTETRKLVRESEKKVENLDNTIRQYEDKLQQLQKQLAYIQTIIFSKGTSN